MNISVDYFLDSPICSLYICLIIFFKSEKRKAIKNSEVDQVIKIDTSLGSVNE